MFNIFAAYSICIKSYGVMPSGFLAVFPQSGISLQRPRM